MDIFEAVSNEIRRKILNMLETPKSFSELCERLNLESSALAFHLKKLDGLVTKDENGNYVLSELGKKALSIINTIESQNLVLTDDQRVVTPIVLEYADKVVIDKNMLTKIKEENKKLVIRNVNEVIFKGDIDENLLNEVLELVENVITVQSPPNLKDVISRKSKQVMSIEEGSVEEDQRSGKETISEDIGEIIGGVGGLVGKIISRVFSTDDSSFNIGSHLRVLYDGPLKVSDSLSVEIDGGVVKISKGDPHLFAKCRHDGDLDIYDSSISADGCYLRVTYPDLNQLKVNVDGGKVEINGIKANNLKVNVDGGLVNLNMECKDSVDISLDGGKAEGDVHFKDTTKARLNIDIDGGVGKFGVTVPKEFSIITSSRVSGGVTRLPPSKAGSKGELAINTNVDGGTITVDVKEA
ncbi:winged helix-turn-helix domain-containing protein [Sulfolobus acidocaldarius]|uniref:HTH arsR-type domain-containing protein n=4 Tax=Sulfolobus acidocaldarius TaxID=2285 RepID=Q4J7E9_SULAC|nr:transcriptional regulator [Sulfolobus acidocaldarius]AAY81281.1 hypothetical protein Saci_1979 [Sulfolobus acidocaldarius DSM 639]AGE71915.1 hypothetical protein SacN8_09790 [Sulfolobus acidocaldarius N8]AGE74188.1 hypothetical protein SacRon12I_09815 [Sulfolobus acidocaldarius Ron12/I]ALU29915.1 hypothetical protein ATY89_08170 [Sulfolobus acidocaldarius]ALU32657.1 hypothetical protein ATZ20_11190 [Sulfolobus acidocaldarius]